MMKKRPSGHASANASTAKNIHAIDHLEKRYLRQRTLSERVGNWISIKSGRMWVVCLHAAAFGVWILVNSGLVGSLKPFDPYPFTFLTLVVSLEAIFLTFFVLMGQNAQTTHAERWTHLDLQVNLLAEQEMTLALEMLRDICVKLDLQDIANKKDLKEMLAKTRVEQIAKSLEAAVRLGNADRPPLS